MSVRISNCPFRYHLNCCTLTWIASSLKSADLSSSVPSSSCCCSCDLLLLFFLLATAARRDPRYFSLAASKLGRSQGQGRDSDCCPSVPIHTQCSYCYHYYTNTHTIIADSLYPYPHGLLVLQTILIQQNSDYQKWQKKTHFSSQSCSCSILVPK